MSRKLHFILPLLLLFIIPALSVQRIDVPLQATPHGNEIQNDSPSIIPSTLNKATRKNVIPPQDRSDFLKFDPAGNVLSKAALFGQDDESLDDITVSDPNAQENDSTQGQGGIVVIGQDDEEKQPAAPLGDDEPSSTQPKSGADTKKDSADKPTNDDVKEDPLADDNQDEVKPEKGPTDSKTAETTPATSTDSKDTESAGKTDSKDAKPATSADKKDSEPAAAITPTEKPSTLIKSIVISMGVISGVILMAFVCYYRYQLEKYKIPPFTPPRCCPNCLFPRSFDRNKGSRSETYQMIEVYNPPELSSRM